jgi:hypothetical protein
VSKRSFTARGTPCSAPPHAASACRPAVLPEWRGRWPRGGSCEPVDRRARCAGIALTPARHPRRDPARQETVDS